MSYREFLIDKRVIERNLHKGLVDQKEYEKLLEALPDVQSNAESCRAEVGTDDLDIEDEG